MLLSLELQCHLELLLGFCPANSVYMEDSFMRMIDLSCLFANIFQFIVPLYSSAKHIVLQTRKRKTLCLLRLCPCGVLLFWNELCKKGIVQGLLHLSPKWGALMVCNSLGKKAKNFFQLEAGKTLSRTQ